MKKYVPFFILLFGILSAKQDPSILKDRREKIIAQLSPGAICILSTNKTFTRNNDVEYDFRPDNDFWYLTGYDEAESKLLLFGNTFRGQEALGIQNELLFTLPRNPKVEVWTGKRLGPEGAKKNLGLQQVTSTDSLGIFLELIRPFVDTVYVNTSESQSHSINTAILETDISQHLDSDVVILDAGDFIHPLRHVKDASEITSIQRAIDITGEGLKSAMKRVKPGLNEYQVQATIEFIFKENGCIRLGFPSIIASGSNSTTLHYTKNDREMQDGDLLLMDVGTEVDGYSADVTRTIPVNGRFTTEQREIYSIVLEAQKITFNSAKVGMTLRELHTIAKKYISDHGYEKYFIHGVGHWLGLDVHDVGGKDSTLRPGSVFTIEPGIYLPADDESLPVAYRGIGIRIEDDVLMTEDGPRWMSNDIPKELGDIEKLIQSGNLPSAR